MKKVLIGFGVFVVVLIAALGIAVATFNINNYRGPIEVALGQQTGRTVKLGGDIHIGLSTGGLTISIRDVAFGNPNWASRPNMAGIGLFDLKVGLMALLQHKVEINGLKIENADILLESASGNRHNWDMQVTSKSAGVPAAPAAKTNATASTSTPVTIDVDNLSIKNSQIAIRGDDGKMTVFKAEDLTLGRKGSGFAVNFSGDYNDLPIKLAVNTNGDDLMSKSERPVDVDFTFANYHLTAKGQVDLGGTKASFSEYQFTAGDSKMIGKFSAAWGGARQVIQASMTSDKLSPDDFKMPAQKGTGGGSSTPAPAAAPSGRAFSTQPMDFSGLKSADVNLEIAVGALALGSVELKDIQSKIQIHEGHLFVTPFKAALGAGSINGQFNLDAGTSPAHMGATFNLADVDLGDLIKMGGAEVFLSGKANAQLNIATSGNSMHDFASNLNGPITIVSAGGDVFSSAADKLSAGLSNILSPGSGNGNASMNCLVARFIASNGIVKGNGILLDTAAATAAGYGDIDLRGETLNLDFHVKTKLVNLGGLLPAVHIGGTLAHASVGADPAAMVQNVQSLLTGGSMSDGVPDVQTQAGQNACAFALDHPTASNTAPMKGGVVQDLAGKAGGLMKGLFGK